MVAFVCKHILQLGKMKVYFVGCVHTASSILFFNSCKMSYFLCLIMSYISHSIKHFGHVTMMLVGKRHFS